MSNQIERWVWSCNLDRPVLLKGTYEEVMVKSFDIEYKNVLFFNKQAEERHNLIHNRPWWKKLLGIY